MHMGVARASLAHRTPSPCPRGKKTAEHSKLMLFVNAWPPASHIHAIITALSRHVTGLSSPPSRKSTRNPLMRRARIERTGGIGVRFYPEWKLVDEFRFDRRNILIRSYRMSKIRSILATTGKDGRFYGSMRLSTLISSRGQLLTWTSQ